MSEWVTRVFSKKELTSVENGNLSCYIAEELLKLGAPIKFNRFNIHLESKDIIAHGKIRKEVNEYGEYIFKFRSRNETRKFTN